MYCCEVTLLIAEDESMKVQRFALILVSLMLVVGIGYSASRVQVQTETPPSTKLYVGQITDNPDQFVGLAITGDSVTLYICDGQADKGTVSLGEWFIGSVKDNAIDITAPSGNRVQVKIADPTADGQFTLKDATVKKFSLKLDPDAKLLRSEFTLDGTKYVAGWIILADGSVRGSVRRFDGVLSPISLDVLVSSYIK